MKRPKQILTALILLTTMGIPGILFVSFQLRQSIIRHEMEEQLEHQHLETLRIPTNDVLWYEEDKEIIVNGKLFDVKTQTNEGSYTIFTGLFDDKETLVKKQMEDLQKEQPGGSGEETLAQQLVSFELFHEFRNALNHDNLVLATQSYNLYNDGRLLLPDLTPPSPPPKG